MQSTMKTPGKQWCKMKTPEKTVVKNPRGFPERKKNRSSYLLMLGMLSLNKKLLIFGLKMFLPKI